MPETPFVFQWTIPVHQLLPLKDFVNGNLSSTIVSDIPEFEYYLKINHNGNTVEHRGQTSIYLYLKFGNIKKVIADFTFVIESASYITSGQAVYERGKSTAWGYRICTTNEFFDARKRFIANGKFTVKVYGVFKFDTHAEKRQQWIGGELGNKMWADDDTKDFTIVTKDDKEIKVHKLIISYQTEYFTAM